MQIAFTGFTTTPQSAAANSRKHSNIGALAALMAVASLAALVPTLLTPSLGSVGQRCAPNSSASMREAHTARRSCMPKKRQAPAVASTESARVVVPCVSFLTLQQARVETIA